MLTPARLLRTILAAAACLAASRLPTALTAAPQNILVLGDSLSEEFAFVLPFSAPDSNPTEANLRNWIEILAATRTDEISFGNYEGHVAYYGDYRNGGHAYNWAVLGFKTKDLVELINPPLFPTTPEQTLDFISCPRLKKHLRTEVAYAVIFCSGNDLSSLYAELCTGTATPAQIEGLRNNLADTIDFIRAQNATLPIVLVNAPDIGVTPSVKNRAPDPALRAVATAGIAALNTLLADLASARGIALADSFALTRRFDERSPFLLNGSVLLNTGDPTGENRSHYLFAKDGFHAATAAQALIANEILRALNDRYAAGFTLLSNREILATVLGLDPDQPFRDWLAAAGLPAASSATADPDGDGLALLTEFALGLSPAQPGAEPWLPAPLPPAGTTARFAYPADHSGGYAITTAEWSADLAGTWQPVPADWLTTGAATTEISLPASIGPRAFLRLRTTVAP